MLVLIYSWEFLKGAWTWKQWELLIHGFYKKYTAEVLLFLNLLTFFLPLASADQAFYSYATVGKILGTVDQASFSAQGDDKVITFIDFKPEILDVPVFYP